MREPGKDPRARERGVAVRSAKYVLGPMRVPFLLLAPACIAVGIGAACHGSGSLRLVDVALVLVGGIAAHISVNAFNEYVDFRSGLDARTVRTPFSGGSGSLPERPDMAMPALLTAVLTLMLAGATGLYFVWTRGPGLLPLGFLGILLVVVYTPWLTRHPLLCLLAPGLGFGPVMVLGTEFALAGA